MLWMSLHEAAQHLKLSTRTIRRMIKTKTLSSKLENGRRLVLIENKNGQDENPKNNTDKKESKHQDDSEIYAKNSGTYTAKILRPLFDAYENLVVLESKCCDLWGALVLMEKWPSSEDEQDKWKRKICKHLYLNVHICLNNVGSIVTDMRTPEPRYRPLLEKVYLRMVDTKKSWIQYTSDFMENSEIKKGEILIDRIVEDIKKILIRYARRPTL